VRKPEGHTFRCAENKPGRKALPLCRRPERTPKGQTTDLIAFAVAVVFFFKFSKKIACQAPYRLNPLPDNNIRLAFIPAQSGIIKL